MRVMIPIIIALVIAFPALVILAKSHFSASRKRREKLLVELQENKKKTKQLEEEIATLRAYNTAHDFDLPWVKD